MGNEDQFEKGDVVRLKSGGPKMTVADRSSRSSGLLCQWFDDDGQPKSKRYAPEVLEKVEE